MTSSLFCSDFADWADDELRADIALCRKVLADGEFNRYPLDDDTYDQWKAWLGDLVCELEVREHPEEYAADPLPTDQKEAA